MVVFRPALVVALCTAGAADLSAQQRPAEPMSPLALRSRLEAYAADSMRGRLTGTPDNVKATRYIAGELRKLGLTPAGEKNDSSFLQRVPLVRSVLDTAASSLTVAGRTLRPYEDFLPRDQGPNARAFDGVPVIFAGVWGDSANENGMLYGDAVAGKVVVLATPADNYSVIKLEAQALFSKAAAIVIANFETMPGSVLDALSASPLRLGGEGRVRPGPPLPSYMHVSGAAAADILGVPALAGAEPGHEGRPITGQVAFRDAPVEAYNVVAVLRGSDPALRDEYVAVGAHSDHVGTTTPQDRDSTRAFNLELRAKQVANNGLITQAIYESINVDMDSIRALHPQPRLDSVYNGADDDGSGSMGVLEIARAFSLAPAETRPKRSILFVWHTGEELGLFGSEHFTDHPTVPRDAIIAQVNLDMIGRGMAGDEVNGGPDYLQLIGSRRLSTQLGDLVEAVNKEGKFGWEFDYQYDATGHPEQYYCRSDHYMYARYGIPVVFMTTGGHADYHEVTDEVEFIDFDKLSRVSRFVHAVTTHLANAGSRPAVNKARPNPHGRCVQ